MNISWDQTSGILRRMNSAGMLKSTKDRLERQEETQKQVAFFEKQKENLKNVTCGDVEEIAKKLKMFQSYEDQIAAVKAAYNQEQMFHILDESTERGEKIAEAADKMEPKTPEERLEEMAREAMGVEDGGELEEVMDELQEVVEEMTEETLEEIVDGGIPESVQEADKSGAEETVPAETVPAEDVVEAGTELMGEAVQAGEGPAESAVMADAGPRYAGTVSEETIEKLRVPEKYVPFDVRL